MCFITNNIRKYIAKKKILFAIKLLKFKVHNLFLIFLTLNMN